MAQGVPGRLRPRIVSTFATTRVVGRQPNSPAAFTLGEIPGTHFQRVSRPQGTWFYRKEPRKNSSVTSLGIDPETVRLVAQCLNHYATQGPTISILPERVTSSTCLVFKLRTVFSNIIYNNVTICLLTKISYDQSGCLIYL